MTACPAGAQAVERLTERGRCRAARFPATNRPMPFLAFLASVLLFVGAGSLSAQERWTAAKLEDEGLPPEIVAETRQPAPEGLPDGLVATHDGDGDIAAAWYGGPTTRYRHGALGDTIEASVLIARTAGGSLVSFTLPLTEVFEDRYPRLADLDGDGTVEIVTIRSSLLQGASVTVYGLDGDSLVERATTGFIGFANRWLNIAGIARFRGARSREIAFVRTPHMGGTLFFCEYADGALRFVAEMSGFSNHALGSTELRLSAVADIDGDGRPDLALPSADRKALRVVGFTDERLTELATAALPHAIDKAIAVDGSARRTRFIVALETGEVYAVHPGRWPLWNVPRPPPLPASR